MVPKGSCSLDTREEGGGTRVEGGGTEEERGGTREEGGGRVSSLIVATALIDDLVDVRAAVTDRKNDGDGGGGCDFCDNRCDCDGVCDDDADADSDSDDSTSTSTSTSDDEEVRRTFPCSIVYFFFNLICDQLLLFIPPLFIIWRFLTTSRS